jgi:hypothetical protein
MSCGTPTLEGLEFMTSGVRRDVYLRSSGVLCSDEWQAFTDVSGKNYWSHLQR